MPELVSVMIAGIALVVSVIVFVDNRLRAQQASRLARVPMLAFTWEPRSGWTLTNIGNGPALDVVIIQRVGGQWKHPLRMPELGVQGSDLVPMGWISWEENPGLGARYRSITGERYMTKTSRDWSQHSQGWEDMPDALWDEVEPHWLYAVEAPPEDDPHGREPDEPHGTIGSPYSRQGLGRSRPRILVSYRRADLASVELFVDPLRARLGEHNVLSDHEFIGPGTGPAAGIDRLFGYVDILVVVIGRAWLEEVGGRGQRRLDDPNDSVRQEIEEALRRGIAVVPVSVNGARMPRREELPASLARFASLQPVELRDGRWADDIARLVSYIS